jgi:hypothetical protein
VTTRTASNPSRGGQGLAPASRSSSRPASQYPAASSLVPSPPSAIHLSADTILLILLDRQTPQADGSVIFHGTLIDPVSQSGAIVLREKTEVIGFTMRSSGKLSLYIEEFIVHGTTYKLKGAPVAGSMTELENGTVIETRLTAASLYERNDAGQTPPHK